MAGEAEDKSGPAPRRDHVDDLRGGAMTVAADQDGGVGPRLTQRSEEPDQAHRIFRPGGACARTQGGRHQRV